MNERGFDHTDHEFERDPTQRPDYPRPSEPHPPDHPSEQNPLWQSSPKDREPEDREEQHPSEEFSEEFSEELSEESSEELYEEPIEERGPEVGSENRRGAGGESSLEAVGAKDTYTIGEIVARLRQEFPSLSVSKVRYLERRRLINLSRTRGGYRLFSAHDVELLRYILTLQERDYLPLKVIKKRIESGEPIPSSRSEGSEVPRVLEERTYTREELADAIETEPRFVDELASVGVIGRHGGLTQRDLEIARLALEMARYSIQPRHLRGIMAAVDREAAMFKQVLNPELRSGDQQRLKEALGKAHHLASVDSRMKELMMTSIIETFGR